LTSAERDEQEMQSTPTNTTEFS